VKRLAVVAACLALSACTSGGKPSPSASPSVSPTPTIAGVVFFPGLAHDHVQGPVTYPQTPPVGGPHNPVWLTCGVYGQPVPNEHAVHSMEHGAVWITYQPNLSRGDVDVLHRLQALKPAYVLISPFPGDPAPVVASTWGLQLKVQKVDDPRLADFVKQYAGGGQGGEPGASCARGGGNPEQLRQLDATQHIVPPTPGA
jgi:hypothetical protein